MIRTYLPFVALIFAAFACTTPDKTSVPVDFSGNWVNKEYLEAIRESHSPKEISEKNIFYVTEFRIDSLFKDSIIVYNGQQGYSVLPVERKGDVLRVKLNKDPYTDITYDTEQKTLVFTDKVLNRVFRFVKAEQEEIDGTFEVPIAFPSLVNKATFTGKWKFIEQNKEEKVIDFSSKGQVKGWGEYTDYSVCINGDCAVNEEGDVVVLTNQSVVHAYGFHSKSDTLILFDLAPRASGKYGMGRPLGLMFKTK